MDEGKPELHEAMLPMLFIWNALALSPVSLSRTFVVKKIDLFDICKLILFASLVTFQLAMRPFKLDISYYTFHFLCFTILPLIMVFSDVWFRPTFAGSLTLLRAIDQVFSEMSSSISNKKMRTISIIQTVMFPIVILLIEASFISSWLLYNTHYVGTGAAYYILFPLPYSVVSTMTVWQFSTFVLCFRARFKALNQLVLKLIASDTKQDLPQVWRHPALAIAPESSPDLLLSKLHVVSKLHNDLCDAAKMLNRVFHVALLLFSGIILLDIINAGYHVIATPTLALEQIPTNVLSVCNLIFLVGVCTITKSAAEETGVLVQSFRKPSSSYARNEWVNQFSYQLLHQNTNFSAMEFFSIDYSMALSILGSTVMFLIYVIQIQTTVVPTTPTGKTGPNSDDIPINISY